MQNVINIKGKEGEVVIYLNVHSSVKKRKINNYEAKDIFLSYIYKISPRNFPLKLWEMYRSTILTSTNFQITFSIGTIDGDEPFTTGTSMIYVLKD